MTDTALVIGGTRFIGRHTVSDLLANSYEVGMLNRGTHENPFSDDDRVTHVEGDRKNERDLRTAKLSIEPDIVIDCVAYQPTDVETATDVFADVDGYVYISSGTATPPRRFPNAKGRRRFDRARPNRRPTTNRRPTGTGRPRATAPSSRPPRRGSGDGGAPCIVYGPYDYTERLDYWIDRVLSQDHVVVPGDGQNLWHRAYVEDVASGLRIVAERGEAGAAYNVGDRQALTLAETLETIADAAGTDCEVVTASADALAAGGLEPDDFVLYREYPHLLDTCALADLGWESTPVDEAMARTVAEHRDADRDGSEWDPGREAEERVLGVKETL